MSVLLETALERVEGATRGRLERLCRSAGKDLAAGDGFGEKPARWNEGERADWEVGHGHGPRGRAGDSRPSSLRWSLWQCGQVRSWGGVSI